MVKKLPIVITLLLLLSNFMVAQEITGLVFDKKTNAPIEGVNISITKYKVGTISNSHGKFTFLQRVKRNPQITFSHISYRSRTLSYKAFVEQQYTIYLEEKIEPLNEVSLTAERNLFDKIQYQYLPTMPLGVYNVPSVVYNDKIYVFGGNSSTHREESMIALEKISHIAEPTLSDFIKVKRANLNWETYSENIQTFDFNLQQWTSSALKLNPKAFHNVAVLSDQFYVFSGRRLSTNRRQEYLVDKIEIINPKLDSIEVDKTNPHQASNPTSFVYDGNLIILGGSLRTRRDGNKKYTDQVNFLNSKTGLWYTLAPMLQAKETSGILVNDAFYTFGGEHINPITNIDKFDLISGEWTRLGDLFEPVATLSLTQHKQIIYGYSYRKLIVFDCQSKVLKEYAIDLDLMGAQLQTDGEYGYIFGGYTVENFTTNPSNSTLRFSLEAFEETKIRHEKTVGQGGS